MQKTDQEMRLESSIQAGYRNMAQAQREQDDQALEVRIASEIDRLRRDGIVAMSVANLKQCATSGLSLWFPERFDDAFSKASRKVAAIKRFRILS